MKIENTISINIKRMRNALGMSIVEAAKKSGISRQAFSNIEKGTTKEPRVSNLQRIAKVLNVRLMDLFIELPKLETVRFRSNAIKTGKDKAKKEQSLRDAAFWLKDFNFLQSLVGDERNYKFKTVFKDIKRVKRDRCIKASKQARDVLRLKDNEPIGDIVSLMEDAGVKVKTRDLDLENFFGFSIAEVDGGPAIVVNTNKNITIERQIFTVAHELGHLVLHPEAYVVSKERENEKEEKKADRFASYFLMPRGGFKKKWEESYGLGFIDRVMHVKRFFGVSYLSVLHRLEDMRVGDHEELTARFREIYHKKYGKRLDDSQEPFGLEEPDFVEDYLRSLVRKALDKSQITVSRAAEILNIPITEMRETINSWAEVAA